MTRNVAQKFGRCTMPSTLYCAVCRTRLSPSLEIATRPAVDQAPTAFAHGSPVVPTGHAIRSSQPAPWISAACRILMSVPQHWLNPEDVAAWVRESSDGSGMSGCCGPTGLSGPNQQCRRCRSLVGVLQDDCITPRVFLPDPEKTFWAEQDADHLPW